MTLVVDYDDDDEYRFAFSALDLFDDITLLFDKCLNPDDVNIGSLVMKINDVTDFSFAMDHRLMISVDCQSFGNCGQ